MTTTSSPNTTNLFTNNYESNNLPGSPVISSEDLLKQEKKKEKKEKKKNKNKKKSVYDPTAEEPVKPIRQAVGVIVIDPATQKVLMLESRKRPGAYVLPRDDCQTEEHPEKAALRLLMDKAGVSTSFLSCRVGSYSESNKKGRVIAHHWMYEVHAPTLLETWPESDRQRVWMPYEDALKAVESKRMSHLALQKCSLAKKEPTE